MTKIIVTDEQNNCYYIVYPAQVDAYEGDTITVYGIPIAMTSYENINNGTTIALFMAGSYIDVNN